MTIKLLNDEMFLDKNCITNKEINYVFFIDLNDIDKRLTPLYEILNERLTFYGKIL